MKLAATKSLMFRADGRLIAQLRTVAKTNGISVSQLLRICVNHGLPIAEARLGTLVAKPSRN